MTRSSVATAPAAGVASCTARLRPIAGSDSKAANPYHRLIKDYKLVSESLNDPVADARLAGSLFGDEVRSLRGMAQAAPDMFRCLRFLLGQTGGAEPRITKGLKRVFLAADGPDMPTNEEVRTLIRGFLGQMACRRGAEFFSETDFSTDEARWALMALLPAV